MEPISLLTAIVAAVPSIIAAIQFWKRKRYEDAAATIINTIEKLPKPVAAQVKTAVHNQSIDDGNRQNVHTIVQTLKK